MFNFFRAVVFLLLFWSAGGTLSAADSLFEAPAAAAPEADVTRVEGVILRISQLASPGKSDYPDCYYVAEFQVKSIIGGPPVPETVALAIPGFMNYKYTPYAKLGRGSLLRADIVSFEKAKEKERSTQQCDDLNMMDNEMYFLRSGSGLRELSALPDPEFKGSRAYESQWDTPLNPPLPAAAVSDRLQTVERSLAGITGNPRSESQIRPAEIQRRWAEMQKNLPLIKPNVFWFSKGTGVFALQNDITYCWDEKIPDNFIHGALPALVALKDFLKNKNVDLILVIYPLKYPLSIRAALDETREIPLKMANEMTKMLLDNGIETIDLSPEMVKLIPDSEFLLYYYHFNDHPGWETQNLAGRLISERLKRYGIPRELDPSLFSEQRIDALDENYVYPAGLPIGDGTPGTPIKTNCTYYNGKSTSPNPESPVLLVGNSFLSWPKNYALATAIAKYSCSFPDIRRGGGCFTSILKDMLIYPEQYLKNKKVVVMPIACSMLASRKFWNIKDIDETMKLRGSIRAVTDIPLPDSVRPENCAALRKEAEPLNLDGNFYELGRGGRLLIPVDGIPASESKRLLRISFVNDDSITFKYGGKSKFVAAPAMFQLDTVYFEYDGNVREIELISGGADRHVLITGVELLELGQPAGK